MPPFADYETASPQNAATPHHIGFSLSAIHQTPVPTPWHNQSVSPHSRWPAHTPPKTTHIL